MGWAATRIDEYQQGKCANWLERRMLEHANPVHFLLAIIAGTGFVYGLWTHDWMWIIVSAALSFLGHVYSWLWRPGRQASSVSGGTGRPETADLPTSIRG
jgi:hypothetical protein